MSFIFFCLLMSLCKRVYSIPLSLSIYIFISFNVLFYFLLNIDAINFTTTKKEKLKNFFFLYFKLIFPLFFLLILILLLVFLSYFNIHASHILHLDNSRRIAFGIDNVLMKKKSYEIWKMKQNWTNVGRCVRICSCCVGKVPSKLVAH